VELPSYSGWKAYAGGELSIACNILEWCPRLSLNTEETDSQADVRVRAGLMILNDVVPRILEEGRRIGERETLAETMVHVPMLCCGMPRYG